MSNPFTSAYTTHKFASVVFHLDPSDTGGMYPRSCFGIAGHKNHYKFRLANLSKRSEEWFKMLQEIFPFEYKDTGQDFTFSGTTFYRHKVDPKVRLFEFDLPAPRGYKHLVFAGNMIKCISEFPELIDDLDWNQGNVLQLFKDEYYNRGLCSAYPSDHLPLGYLCSHEMDKKEPSLKAIHDELQNNYKANRNVWVGTNSYRAACLK